MTHGGERVFRRRRRTRFTAPAWLWLGLVFLLGGSSLALFLWSFSWDDSQPGKASTVPPIAAPSTGIEPSGVKTINDFGALADKSTADPRPASKIDPADEKVLKGLVPTQSAGPDR